MASCRRPHSLLVQEDNECPGPASPLRRAVPCPVSNLTYVIVAAVIALVALGFAAALVKAVLATGKGTQKMQEIAGAVQEGAQAYLLRQFKTLGIFVVIAVVLLFLLPVNEVSGSETSVKIGRSLFFIVGAVFSAFIGGAGMALATRANLRVRRGRRARAAAAARRPCRSRSAPVAWSAS